MYQTEDTIAAIGTAMGGAARGMVRLSGPRMAACLAGCFQSDRPRQVEMARCPQMISGTLSVACHDREDTVAIPCELFLWPGKRSYTRQPAAELHLPGSPPLLEMALDGLCAHGARVAEPGEFTLRAFLAGRIDLTRAEAVLGVIDAGSSRQLDVALEQMAGGLSGPLLKLREDLLQLLAQVEAGLDFVAEEIEFISRPQILDQLARGQKIVAAIQLQMVSRADQATLPRVVLLGKPNAGKSSLFNALSRQYGSGRGVPSSALVSGQPGTTRDYVTARLEGANWACELIDTAGDEPQTGRSALGQAAHTSAHEQYRRADVRLLCIAAADLLANPAAGKVADWPSSDRILVTQSDRISGESPCRLLSNGLPAGAIVCSSQTGEGLQEVLAAIEGLVLGAVDAGPQAVAATATRCAGSLRRTAHSLARAQRLTAKDGGMELIATELRIALDALGKVVGAIYTDDILDRIFAQFCIGK